MKNGVLKRDIVIIGNGVAGNNAALAARNIDKEVDISIVSQEVYNEYSPCALPDYIAGYISKKEVFVRDDKHYSYLGIEKIFGEKALKIDSNNKIVFLNSKNIQYNKLILATGSNPIIPPIKGHSLKGNFSLKTLKDADDIINYPGKTAVIVGSGAVGVETAIALKTRGYEDVTIVEMMNWILPKSFDQKPARIIEEILYNNGIHVLTGERLIEVLGENQVQGVRTNKREMTCDIVVWAVGVRPAVDLAKTCGVKLGEFGGIKVDKYLKTNIEDIYACGDCIETFDIFTKKTGLNLLWDAAYKQGIIAGLNCVGLAEEYLGSYAVLLVDIFGVKALAFGLNSTSLLESRCDIWEKESPGKFRRLVFQDDEILGLQLIGTLDGAGPILHMMKKGEKPSKIIEIIENPSLAARIVKPALIGNNLGSFFSRNMS